MVINPDYTYEQLGKAAGLQNWKRQWVYKVLRTKGFKRKMNEISKKLYDESALREKLNEFLNADKNDKLKLESILLGMRERGMLIDTVKTIDKPDVSDLSNISTDQLQSELVKRLRVGQAGVFSPAETESGNK